MKNNSKKHSKVLIMGSGPAGYTAAIYTARAMLKPILVHGSEPGGQMTTTTDVQNYPGYTDVIQGPWLMEQMKGQAKTVGTDMIQDHIKKVDLNKKPFKAIGDSGQEYTGDSIIISTGAQARWLNLKSEQEYRGFGVSGCATCDGFFFKDKEVAVIGGGNAAVEEAIFLTKFATKVKLIHRRDKLRAEKMLQKKLTENKKIEILIDKYFVEGVDKIIIITGKGLRSKNIDNPYVSKDLSILKNSVPNYINANSKIKNKIKSISKAELRDGGEGAIYIFLKSNKKFTR